MSLSGRTLGVSCATAVLVAAAGVVAATAAAGSDDPAPPRRDQPARSVVQGPALQPAKILSPGGTKLTCPTGAEPTVNLEQVTFSPPLIGGTRLRRGVTTVMLRGTVDNETNSPVLVTGVSLVAGGVPWHPSVGRPARLGPGESQPLIVRGSLRSARARPARVAAYLRWQWQVPALRSCGNRGLIVDD